MVAWRVWRQFRELRWRPPGPWPLIPASPPAPPAARYGTLVAAKILKGSNEIALGDFRGEIEILRRVHHPNAVQVGGRWGRRHRCRRQCRAAVPPVRHVA